MNASRLALTVICSVLLGGETCCQRAAESPEVAREQMIRQQLMARGISDEKVLAAMRKVPREDFVPDRLRSSAYADSPLPIGYDQTISQPYIVAIMTELLGLKGDEKVLEIGTGSGYQAAILARISPHVYTIEIVPELAQQARARLEKLGVEASHVIAGDGYRGLPEVAPFDAIIVTAAPEQIPQPLLDQLKPGGRMVIPVGPVGVGQELLVIEKDVRGKISKRSVLPVAFVPMTGDAQKGSKR